MSGETSKLLGEKAPTPEPAKSETAKACAVIPYAVWWAVVSAGLVMFNKWVYIPEGGNFPFPIFLTMYHMCLATVITSTFRWFAPASWRDNIMPSVTTVSFDFKQWAKTIPPIGFLNMGALALGNFTYMYLSVAFIQMIKALMPVFVSLVAFAFGLEVPTLVHICIMMLIAGGVSLASIGEMQFVLVGFLLCMGSLACECTRLNLVNLILSSKGVKMDPITALYFFAPVSCFFLFGAFMIIERDTFSIGAINQLGWHILAANGAVAFCLNLAIVFLIKKSSAVVFTLTGVFKDFAIIAISCPLFHTVVTPLQIVGYAFAICGIQLYRKYKQNIDTFKTHGSIRGLQILGKAFMSKGEEACPV